MSGNPTLGFLLHDVARLLRKRFEQRARCLGLTRSQWQTLACLRSNEGIHQGGLAEILEIEPITLVRIVDKLADRALIERRQHPTDRRIWLLYLREEAHPLLAEMRELGELTRCEAFQSVPPEQRDQLFDILSAMKTNLVEACRTPVAEHETRHG
ncbi:DNA-binding MarR family transcriptional regulator [Rhizobium tibeticum]|uniref:MarR family winged helix-turn-helix transcriptional regulator n=1 Tax=Rhizobium tibeticum TaxID=501024 RepID=UPI00277E7A5B|nr:MarR family transcriptional regulator [Rhizobium tibeticum]MDP9813044.1 DNA-binding MarR family transcriptional regulator [Rhizobium tibeticum]